MSEVNIITIKITAKDAHVSFDQNKMSKNSHAQINIILDKLIKLIQKGKTNE